MGMGGCGGLGFNPGRSSSSSRGSSCSTSRAVWSWQSPGWQSCFILVVAVIMTTQTSGVVGTTHSAGSLTPAELVRANSAGAVHTAVDSTSIVSQSTSFGIAFAFGKLWVAPGGPTRSIIVLDPITNATASLANVAAVANSYFGFAFAAVTSKLYACPYNAPAVLVVDPLTNATDVATLANLPTGSGKWSGFAFAPNTGKLYAAPARATSVLIVDPVANTTDTTSIVIGAHVNEFYEGIVWCPRTGKLYCAPHQAGAVLVVDPATNAWDMAALAGLGNGGNKWAGIAFAPNTGKLYAVPDEGDAVLIVDPVTNATDTTALSGLGLFGDKWTGVAFSPVTQRLYATPDNATAILVIDPATNQTTMLGTFPSGSDKWYGFAFAPNVNRLFAPARAAATVLSVGFSVSWDAPTAAPTLPPTAHTATPSPAPTAQPLVAGGSTAAPTPQVVSQTAPDDSRGGSASVLWAIVGVVAALLLILGVVLAVMVRKRRAKTEHIDGAPGLGFPTQFPSGVGKNVVNPLFRTNSQHAEYSTELPHGIGSAGRRGQSSRRYEYTYADSEAAQAARLASIDGEPLAVDVPSLAPGTELQPKRLGGQQRVAPSALRYALPSDLAVGNSNTYTTIPDSTYQGGAVSGHRPSRYLTPTAGRSDVGEQYAEVDDVPRDAYCNPSEIN